MNARATALRTSVAAMFAALTFLVAYLPTIPGSAFKFMGFPLLLGGMLIGPRTGFAVGCLTDLINFALHPSGPFFPGFTLTQGLTAMLPGLATWGRDPLTWRRVAPRELELTKKGEPLPPSNQLPPLTWWASCLAYLRLLLIFGVTKALTSVLLVSYFTSRYVAGTPLEAELISRAAIQAVHVPIYALLALLVLQGLASTDLYTRMLKARR